MPAWGCFKVQTNKVDTRKGSGSCLSSARQAEGLSLVRGKALWNGECKGAGRLSASRCVAWHPELTTASLLISLSQIRM